jgi:MFS family permease
MIALLGLATAPYFWVFLAFSFLFGLSQGVLGLVPNVLVPLGTSEHRKQQMLSGLHTMYGVASLLAPLLAAAVEHFTGSWRWTFAAAIVGPASLLAYTFHGSHKNLHTRSRISDEDYHAHKAKNFRPQVFLALMLSFAVATEIMLSSRLALYMQRVWAYDMETSSLYVTYFFIFMMLGRGLFTVVHFRQSPQFLLTTSIFTTGICILLGVFVHPLFLAVGGFTVAPFYPLSISWISSEFPQDLDSVVSYMMATDSLMLIIMHLGIGKMTDLIGIQNAVLSGLAFVLLSFSMIHLYRPLFKK